MLVKSGKWGSWCGDSGRRMAAAPSYVNKGGMALVYFLKHLGWCWIYILLAKGTLKRYQSLAIIGGLTGLVSILLPTSALIDLSDKGG